MAGEFSTWGETARENSTGFRAVQQNLRFQGEYLDRETGLHYNLFRYYDPVSGRFTQVDPIGLAGGDNLYAYAQNPLTWIDPLGLSYIPNTFKAQFRAAKKFLKIPKNINTSNPVKVYDNKYEIRTVWKYEVNSDTKYIVMHEEDKFGRGPHFHTADDLHGDPFEPKIRYNQHSGHYPEEFKGLNNMKGRKKCR